MLANYVDGYGTGGNLHIGADQSEKKTSETILCLAGHISMLNLRKRFQPLNDCVGFIRQQGCCCWCQPLFRPSLYHK